MSSAQVFERLGELTRREVVLRGLSLAGWGAFATVTGAGLVETVRFFFPQVELQMASHVRIGTPEEFVTNGGEADVYGVVQINERWKGTNRFFVVRERDRIYALSARCSHLGCTVNWFDGLREFKCPCHGSEYHSNGLNFAGPTPRSLNRLGIEMDADRQLVVDINIIYGPERFGVDGAFVQV